MPWFELNGLLPGRAIGRGMPMPWFELNGLLPGRGIPMIELAEAGAAGATGAAGAGASGTEDSSRGAGLLTGAAGAEVSTCGAAAFGSAFLGAALPAFGYAARSFAATGGVMVEEPPLTYSPSSSSLDSATFVSMPSSLARSYTRGSAT